MKDAKYIFVGNRFYVLDKLLKHNCNVVKIFCVKNSSLTRYLEHNNIEYEQLTSKQELVAQLKKLDYDFLISNGCPYILPITEIKNALSDRGINAKFINVHTSLLPDCRGKHPVNAALLYGRRHGVTCHYMDDGIDTGKVIEQIEIPITDDVSLELLYRLSFIAEGDVFEKAFNNGFIEKKSLVTDVETIYYTRRDEDLQIKSDDSVDTVLRKVRSFSAKGQYAKIELNKQVMGVKSAKVILNEYIVNMLKNKENNSICLAYGQCVLLKRDNTLIELEMCPEYDVAKLVDELYYR